MRTDAQYNEFSSMDLTVNSEHPPFEVANKTHLDNSVFLIDEISPRLFPLIDLLKPLEH
jgi:hypothetical protein